MTSAQYYDFTIWSSFQQSNDASFQSGQRELLTTQRFLKNDKTLPFNHPKPLEASTLNIIQLDTYTSAVDDVLKSFSPRFPCELLGKVVENTSSRQNTSVIPSAYKHQAKFSCLMNHPFLFETSLAGFLPIAIWVGPSPSTQLPDENASIFIICTSPAVGRLVNSHYSSDIDKRWTRMQQTHLWIFADLLHIFGAWGQVLNTTKRNLTEYQGQIYDSSTTTPLVDLTRTLHSEIAQILSVREQLRVHKSAITRFLRLNDVVTAQNLAERARDHLEDIIFHEETSEVILRQLENLTSLAFNIETITQGQAVARLNVLAFAFLPLSWVAGIFGMTQFSISAAWYPLWAFAVLVALILVPLVVPRNDFCRYLIGNSAPDWMRRMGLLPSAKASKNNSFENRSRSAYRTPSRMLARSSSPRDRDVGADF